MIRFLKTRFGQEGLFGRQFSLGSLEVEVMQIVWARGESSVRDVFEKIERRLAYTTVMTTLERLFRKGLLDRHKAGRAFLYLPRMTRQEWEQRRAGDLVATFLAGTGPRRDLLVSCFLEAVGQQDDLLLEELEKAIRIKRRELSRRCKP